ncbi:set domain protein [Culex quinquefasciatus]|uniref:Set domain protein n=1 Tax=Culex quinquefasciatus TaxID=7176 RepID=B0XJV1_CULQU|nr:set domain protein [Culex quinquefasciatus]|eukprot:XP_001869923.1 set domain protein [Culex quinquefasciatus]
MMRGQWMQKQLLTTICPKHSLEQCSINISNWCFLCCKGGSFICSETCLTTFHLECRRFNPPESRYICEEFDSGRMPLYDEIVWAKYSVFMFWPRFWMWTSKRTFTCARHARFWLDQLEANLPLSRRRLGQRDDLKRSSIMERYNEARQIFERLQAEKAHAQESAPDDLSCLARSSASNESSTRYWRPNGSDRAGGHPPWYVGEVINNEELARRIKQKQDQKVENYYFLTMNTELTTDSGPKGNVARFIYHSCEPNCETLLWKVGGSQYVGLFALKDLKAPSTTTLRHSATRRSASVVRASVPS